MREQEIIRWLRNRERKSEGVLLGIGDDAAILSPPGAGPQVLTTDLLVEGTHFTAEDPPRDVGWKSLAVSVSDVAAMGCRATAAVLSVGLDARRGWTYARELFQGAEALAERFSIPLVGGDTTESRGGVVLCSTVLGAPLEGREPIRRSGARPGDALLVTGRLGGTRAGRHLRFVPRQEEALALVADSSVTAMIDLSDGLSTDAAHLARESGVELRILADRVPLSNEIAGEDDALGHALRDGEDFELLLTVPAEAAESLEREGVLGLEITRLGEVRVGDAAVTLVDRAGREERLREGGYEHFR